MHEVAYQAGKAYGLTVNGYTRGLDAAQTKSAARALDSLRQLERLVESMLSFARGAVVDASPLLLGELLTRLSQEAAALLGDEHFAIACEASLQTLMVHGNADALHQKRSENGSNKRANHGPCRVVHLRAKVEHPGHTRHRRHGFRNTTIGAHGVRFCDMVATANTLLVCRFLLSRL